MPYVITAALLGLIPAYIAKEKGYSFGAWWLYGFLLFIVAIVHAIVLPDKRGYTGDLNIPLSKVNTSIDSNSSTNPNRLWIASKRQYIEGAPIIIEYKTL